MGFLLSKVQFDILRFVRLPHFVFLTDSQCALIKFWFIFWNGTQVLPPLWIWSVHKNWNWRLSIWTKKVLKKSDKVRLAAKISNVSFCPKAFYLQTYHLQPCRGERIHIFILFRHFFCIDLVLSHFVIRHSDWRHTADV